MALPANITAESDSNVLTIAASNNKGLLIRFLNEQVEDGFYALVIDYLKDSNFDLKNMMVDDDVKTQCTKLYELGEFVDTNIKATGRYEIEEWIEPLFIANNVKGGMFTCFFFGNTLTCYRANEAMR